MGSLAEVGAQLREAREAKGLSLEELSTRTRVSVRHLRAIEAGDETELPELFYVRGFLKKYAEAVGLSPTYVADAYREAPTVATSEGGRGFSAGPIGYYLLLLALIGGGIALAWHFQPRVTVVEGPSPTPYMPPSPAAPPGDKAAPSPSPTARPQIGPTPLGSPAQPSPRPSVASPMPSVSPAPSPSLAPSPPGSFAPSPSASGLHEVQLLIDRRVWIEVRVEGQRVFTGIVPAGDRQRYAGRNVSVVAGSGRAVRVMLDGADAGFVGPGEKAAGRTLP